MDSNIDELRNDFITSLEKIDFSNYSPNSNDFITSLMIGNMWYLMKKLNKVDTSSEDNPIEEEITGAKKYIQKYIDTQDLFYKGIAEDELNHITTLIKKSYSRLPSNEEKVKLKGYEEQLNQLRNLM